MGPLRHRHDHLPVTSWVLLKGAMVSCSLRTPKLPHVTGGETEVQRQGGACTGHEGLEAELCPALGQASSP